MSPIESFYQRMLAGDADEAQEHAEQLLKQCSLSSYYDEVVLKGLQLAAGDASRGVLTKAQLDRIRDAIKGLVHDLDGYDDAAPATASSRSGPAASPASDKKVLAKAAIADDAPPPEELPPAWRREGAVLCIAGRGTLDEAASEMLAQLLRKHGIGARVVPYEAVSRAHVAGLDVKGVTMACISYLEISGSPAHLRYLIRRLRPRLSKAPILVGLWPAEDPVLTNENVRSAIGADYFVTSLREGLAACIKAALGARDTEGTPDSAPVVPLEADRATGVEAVASRA